MAVRIRLSRLGTTNRPFYRLVAIDSRKKRDGVQLDTIGTFDPLSGVVIQFFEDIYTSWLEKGAQASDSVKKIYKLYKKNGIQAAKNTEAELSAPAVDAQVQEEA